MQADAEEIIILPESGLAPACFKRRAQVSDPTLGTPPIINSFLLLPGHWRFLSKGKYAGLGIGDVSKCMHSLLMHLSCKAWFLSTASVASACSAQRLSILRPIY